MNWKIGFFVSLAALAASLSWIILSPAPLHDCKHCFCDADDRDEIPANEAVRQMNAFNRFRDSLDIRGKKPPLDISENPGGTPGLIGQLQKLRGFKLDHNELASILYETGCGSEVWAMLCVKSVNPAVEEIDLLFQIRQTGIPDDLPVQDRYFDFTEPCPTSCPDQ